MKFIVTTTWCLVAAAKLTFAEESGYQKGEILVPPNAVHNNFQSPLPHTYVDANLLPDDFNWGNINGVSYLTKSLNQHLPQYCGSCWAHGALSSLADRIKIARLAQGDDINLSIQFILNCASKLAGSCHGGYHTTTYAFIQRVGFIPYDTCMPYLACSQESKDGFCPHLDTTCELEIDDDSGDISIAKSSMNQVCRTCDTFAGMGGSCSEIDLFPNATVAEYGTIPHDEHVVTRIMTELFVRGPVAATINAIPTVDYKGGIFRNDTYSQAVDHIVSIVGWGTDKETDTKYWIIRNSWGQYWGEMGFMRLEAGKNLLGIESGIAWATPGQFTVHNYPCSEDGKNCVLKDAIDTHVYQDPSANVALVQERLQAATNPALSASLLRRQVKS